MIEQVYNVLHLYSGSGGGALGFQEAQGEFRGTVGRFRTLCGIDVDPQACADFATLTGAPAVQMDPFSREDYIAWHGHEPPAGWREATPDDIRAVTGGESPDAVFLSPPCKGMSGLQPKERAESAKYQALNNLTFRGIWLTLEAWSDDLPGLILLENVPRITTRGAHLLRSIRGLLSHYGYLFHESAHDCGELGGLAQHRRRYLLVARHPEKVPMWLYHPLKQRVRAIGEVLEQLPLPGDPAAGPLHRIPRLEWRTWVRLALIPAGKDWRALQDLDFGSYRITPEMNGQYANKYRVQRWETPAGTVTGSDRLGSGAPSVADPRLSPDLGRNYEGSPGLMSVQEWNRPSRAIVAHTSVTSGNGPGAVADPRVPDKAGRHASHYRVTAFDEPAGTVTGATHVANGAPVVADPRLGCNPRPGAYRVTRWDEPSGAVTGAGDVHSQGAAAVADPRIPTDGDRGVWVIVAEDGTWHRPLTTLELAALQGFPTVMPDGRPLTLTGLSDKSWRERIGNAVPVPAARAIAGQILRTLMMSDAGVWEASPTPVWVQPEQQLAL